MKIVSLLPSATEIVYALGLDDDLVGVSCDCDYPTGASTKPVVSHSALITADSAPADIDREVRASVSASDPIYRLDRELVKKLQPDLILAQDLCRVCAVPSGHVTEALATIGCSSEVLSLDPHGLFDVLGDIGRVGRVAGAEMRSDRLLSSLRGRIEMVREATASLEPVSVLALEWADPPFTGGHWIPEMVSLAGGRELLGVAGAPSRSCTWTEIAEADPEAVVFMPCGFGLDEAVEQTTTLFDVLEFEAFCCAQ